MQHKVKENLGELSYHRSRERRELWKRSGEIVSNGTGKANIITLKSDCIVQTSDIIPPIVLILLLYNIQLWISRTSFLSNIRHSFNTIFNICIIFPRCSPYSYAAVSCFIINVPPLTHDKWFMQSYFLLCDGMSTLIANLQVCWEWNLNTWELLWKESSYRGPIHVSDGLSI